MTTQCALWYWRYHSPHYEIHDSEEEAAASALEMTDKAEGWPDGVQFADGRTVRLDDWPAYREAQARRDKASPPSRKIKHPFDGQTLTVDADEPEWLGVADEAARPLP